MFINEGMMVVGPRAAPAAAIINTTRGPWLLWAGFCAESFLAPVVVVVVWRPAGGVDGAEDY